MPGWKRVVRIVTLSSVGLLVVAQVVPYGRDHANPPIVAEPSLDRSTRLLAERACFDCHSNQTAWPWYSYVAPASWLLQSHVDEGRRALNFSEWNRSYEEAREAGETVRTGSMPPRSYLLLHPAARLTDSERALLATGLDRSLGVVSAD